MPSVDCVLRQIAMWNYIIVTDLVKAFYQIPLAHDSMKYCGVATPFKGVRVYTRSVMGMPGSESHLEELIQEGCVTKNADDLYISGNTSDEALYDWSRILAALRHNLRISAPKTIICPRSAVILGWIWCNGAKIATLCVVEPSVTVLGLRYFVGAYNVLSRVLQGPQPCSTRSSAVFYKVLNVLQGYADLLDPIDQAAADRASIECLLV